VASIERRFEMPTWTIHTDPEAIEWRRLLTEKFPLVAPHRLLRLSLRYGLRAAVMNPDVLITEAAGAADLQHPSAE
jgi:hypothetical protein